MISRLGPPRRTSHLLWILEHHNSPVFGAPSAGRGKGRPRTGPFTATGVLATCWLLVVGAWGLGLGFEFKLASLKTLQPKPRAFVVCGLFGVESWDLELESKFEMGRLALATSH
jgi:hypothetical protein